jgi:cytochrome d ubiquinol oxidase subunit II
MPLLVLAIAFAAWRSFGRGRDHAPFFWVLGLFALSLIGLGIFHLADIIRAGFDLGSRFTAGKPDVHAGRSAVLVPLILAYTAWSYWVFRGKVGESGYHATEAHPGDEPA